MIHYDKSIGEKPTLMELMVYKYLTSKSRWDLQTDIIEFQIILEDEMSFEILSNQIKHPTLILDVINNSKFLGLDIPQRERLIKRVLPYPNKIFAMLHKNITTISMFSIIANNIFENFPDMTKQLYEFIPNKYIEKLNIKKDYIDILNSYRLMEVL